MSFTFTFYVWWLWPYLAVGVITLPWLTWSAYRSVPGWERSGISYWRVLFGGGTSTRNDRRWWVRVAAVAAVVAAWPLALWEELR